jgi:hypothetical protein
MNKLGFKVVLGLFQFIYSSGWAQRIWFYLEYGIIEKARRGARIRPLSVEYLPALYMGAVVHSISIGGPLTWRRESYLFTKLWLLPLEMHSNFFFL